MSGRLGTARGIGAITAIVVAAMIPAPAPAGARDPFPEVHPATRAEAVDLVVERTGASPRCLSPAIQLLQRNAPRRGGPPVARALSVLQGFPSFAHEERVGVFEDTLMRYTTHESAFDRIDLTDADDDGRPDLPVAIVRGLERARNLVVNELSLPAPHINEIVLLELGDATDGYLSVPGGGASGATLVLDATPRFGPDAASRAAIHQFAHAAAIAAGPGVPPEWGEAFAAWAVLALEPQPSGDDLEIISRRLRRLNEGLTDSRLDLAAGNSVWFSFLQELYGLASVRVTLEELARGGPVATALDRAVRRVSSDDLTSALREFHLWTLLVGPRADGLHFSFAERLDPPRFASTSDALPALSVLADSPIAPLGAAQILFAPGEEWGGLRLHFEGDLPAVWASDLLLIGHQGTVRRIRLDLSPEGRGDRTVPLDGLAEAILLVRNIGAESGAGGRYSYAAHLERSYPFELTDFEALRLEQEVLVSWETASESGVIGFNVLREPLGGGPVSVVNPVWIPALGEETRATSYHFADRSAAEGVAYRYRVQGITADGLTSESEPFIIPRAVNP